MVREGDTLAARYRLTTRLGCGGMAEVWLADDLELDRRVAVKLLAPDADRARFEREARAYATCSHPNIACVYDYGEAPDRPYIVLEYLPGGTLEDRLLGDAALSDGEMTRIAGDVAAGMAHAHARGLVHRDLKPANILFDDEGRAKIADFGIAHASDASTFTEAGTILGTAAYTSPEQAAGAAATPASDVYSFGVMLFRMLTGRLPFAATNPMELLLKHVQEHPPPVSRFRSDAPDRLEALTTAALAKDPNERPQDGAALLTTLSSPRSGAATASVHETAATRVLAAPTRRPRSRAAVAGLAALALLVPAGFAAAILATRAGPSDPPPAPGGIANKQKAGTPTSRSGAETSSSRSRTTTPSTRPATTTSERVNQPARGSSQPPPATTSPADGGATTTLPPSTTSTTTPATTAETSGATTTTP
jgi:serine/threonine protein kinase